MFEKRTINDKLYTWINGIITYDMVSKGYLDVTEIIKNTLENGEDKIQSTITINDETYEFKMTLKKIK